MKSIDFWEQPNNPKPSRIILTSAEDADLLQLMLNDPDYAITERVYKLLENGKGSETLFLDYLALIHLSDNELKNHKWVSQSYKTWMNLCEKLKNFDVLGYEAIAEEFKEYKSHLLLKSEILCEFFSDINKKLILPYLDSSVYGSSDSQNWMPQWWSLTPLIIQDLEDLLKKAKRLQLPSAFLIKFEAKINDITHQLKIGVNGTLDNTLLILSAFCFISARLNNSLNRPNTSLLLQHRALDFYLQSLCFRERLIEKSGGHFLRYKQPFNDERLSVTTSIQILQQNQVILQNSERDHFIKRLNNSRNMLLHTHSVYSLSFNEASDNLIKLQRNITSLDGEPKNWANVVKKLNIYLDIPPSLIFDIENSLDTYLVGLERT